MLGSGSPAPALPQVDRRRFPGFRSSGALEFDSPSLRLIPKASPSSPACDHLPVLSGFLSFSIAFELHLTLTVRPFTSATVSAATMASADFWQELPPPDLPG